MHSSKFAVKYGRIEILLRHTDWMFHHIATEESQLALSYSGNTNFAFIFDLLISALAIYKTSFVIMRTQTYSM